MNPEDEVSPATINNVAYDIRENRADPDDVRRVLNYFCLLVEEGEELPFELRELLKDGFRAYLDGPAISVDQGLGLTRTGRGRRPVDEIDQSILAAEYLESRIAGASDFDAKEDVATQNVCGKTKVGYAWKDFKGQAVPIAQCLRSYRGEQPFTDDEWQRIGRIYEKNFAEMNKWFSQQPPTIAPEN